jgi:predicted transposase YdaD
MLQVSDVRQTRVFQEALEEGLEKGLPLGFERGREEGLEKGLEKGLERLAIELHALKQPLATIVEKTGFTPARVRSILKKHRRK